MKSKLHLQFIAVTAAIFYLTTHSTLKAQIQVDPDGVGASGIVHLTKVGNKMFFYGTNETNTSNLDLFMHDGTTSTFVKHLAQFIQNPAVFTSYIHDGYGKAYFHFSSNGGAMPTGLVVSDGTDAGTMNIFNCRQPEWFANCNGKVFFQARLENSSDKELFVSDGTAAGTFQVKDIYPGSSSSQPRKGVEFNNEFWFTALSSTLSGYQLYKSDGTEAGTNLFDYPADLNGSIADLYVHNGLLYFTGKDNTNNKKALWRTDGTTAGTTKLFVGDNTVGTFGIVNSVGNTLIGISTNINVFPQEYSLYAIDALSLDTTLIKRNLYMQSEQAGYGWTLNNKIIFIGKTAEYGNELWITDGTPTGTNMLVDINAGTENTNIYSNAAYANNNLYLNSEKNGIIKTDGTSSGTIAIGVENDNTFFNSFLSIDDEVYFVMDSQDRLMKLFKLGTKAPSNLPRLEQKNILIYPNPTRDFIQIELGQNIEASIEICSINGTIIKTFNHNSIQNQIDISNLPAGIYWVKVKTDKELFESKFIKY